MIRAEQYRSGRTAGRYTSAARAFISPTAFEQARGGALGAGGGRGAGSGSLGAASSESTAGTGERSAPEPRLLSRPGLRVEG